MFLLGSGGFGHHPRARACWAGALEITAPASVPPGRSKSLRQRARRRLGARNRCASLGARNSRASLLGAAWALEIAAPSPLGAVEIAARRCCTLLRSKLLLEDCSSKIEGRCYCFALHCLTLFNFAPCMYIHGLTLVYIYIYRLCLIQISAMSFILHYMGVGKV